jgi:hypothetical protein
MSTGSKSVDNVLGCMKRCEGRALLGLNFMISVSDILLLLLYEIPRLPKSIDYLMTLATILLSMSYFRNFHFLKSINIVSAKLEHSDRFCTKCDAYTDPSSHHCSICQKCIVGLDHHCVFLNVCIAKANCAYFLSYCLDAALLALGGSIFFSSHLIKMLVYNVYH